MASIATGSETLRNDPEFRDFEENGELGSIFSGSMRLSNIGFGSYRNSYTYSSTTDNILELFPNPETPDKPPRTLPRGEQHYRTCCCTCKCSKDQHKVPAEARSMSVESEGAKSREIGFYDRWCDFSGNTTLHGIKYMFAGSKVSKILFILFMVVFVGKLAWQLTESVQAYRSYPTGSKIEVAEFDGPPTVTFPTISVCNHNKVRQSYLDSKPGLAEVWQKMDGWNHAETKNINFSDPAFSMYRNYTYAQILEEGGPILNYTVLQCSHFLHLCQDNAIFGENWITRELSLSGNCFRINPNGLLKGKGGDYGKISLKLFADLNEYSYTGRKLAHVGFAVVLHDHEQYSGALPSSLWMSPGMIYKVDLSLLREFRLPPPAGRCNDTVLYNTYGRHEEKSCMAQCRDDAMMERCGCVLVPPPFAANFTYNSTTSYTACTFERWATCGLEEYINWHVEYADASRTDTMCHCYPACKETFYQSSVSNSFLSEFYADDHIWLLPELGYTATRSNVESNLVVIDILFTNTQETEITEIITYGWGNFLGDVGGVLGLFLGASAFSLIEFLIFGMSITWDFFLCGWVHCMCPDLIPD